jgi:HSP20 family protein
LPRLAELRNSAVRPPDNKDNNRFAADDYDDGASGNIEYAHGPPKIKQKEPLEEIIVADKTIKLVLEMPIVDKKDIKINAYNKRHNNCVEIFCYNQNTRYHRIISIPSNADIMSAKSTYNNGILEITFNKKE